MGTGVTNMAWSAGKILPFFYQVKKRVGEIPKNIGQVVVDLPGNKQGVCTAHGSGKYGWCLVDVSPLEQVSGD